MASFEPQSPYCKVVSWAHLLRRTLGMVLKALGKAFFFFLPSFRIFGAFFSPFRNLIKLSL